VLVGNGDVGLQIRVYNELYPQDVAGAVFVDVNDVEDPSAVPESHQPLLARYVGGALPYVRSAYCAALPTLSRIGLLRLAGRPRRAGGGYGLTANQEREAAFLSDNPTAYVATGTSLCVQDTSRRQARAAGSLGDRPLIVITFPESDDAEASAYWIGTVQPRLAALSTRGRLIVTGSGDIQIREAILSAVVDVLKQVRDNHDR
jgi:hypothetical protein